MTLNHNFQRETTAALVQLERFRKDLDLSKEKLPRKPSVELDAKGQLLCSAYVGLQARSAR